MTKKTFLLLITTPLLGILSCSDNEHSLNLEREETRRLPSLYSTSLATVDRSDLKELIEQEDPIFSSPTRNSTSNNYISLLDVVRKDDPILESFSAEERTYILDSALTYYDALGYEDIVPNTRFARLLNSRGEIQVGDSIYRITHYGVLATDFAHREQLEYANQALKNGTFIIGAFPSVIIKDAYNELKLEMEGSPNIQTRTATEEIPYHSFPTYTTKSHTFVGKILGSVLGDRSVKHHDFMKGYRIKGSFYSYDYLVYSEVGTFVASRRKRRGFFRKINGWKGVRAEELSITYQGVVLELQTNKLPHRSRLPQTPQLINDGHSMDIPGLGSQIRLVDLYFVELSEEQILKFAGSGLKEIFKFLKDKFGHNAHSEVKALRIVTPSKAYIIIPDAQVNEYNVEQVRKVFNSQVKFFLSTTITGNKASLGSLTEFYQGLKGLSSAKLIGGKVILAGKINGQWGGMTIIKE